jgi:cytochrome c-type biogenesis protein
MNQISFWTAFAAGIVSFLSPCVLPLVPGYISFISGFSLEELSHEPGRRKILKKAGLGSIVFVLGFSLVFVLLGASATVVGKFLIAYASILTKIAGVLIVLFGFHTLGILPIRWLYYEKRFEAGSISPGLAGAFLMGLAFAFGWTPCIGPILAGILALASTQETVFQGMGLLTIYSLGLGIPFIITGFGIHLFIQFFNRYKKFIRWGEIVAGILLIFIGVLIFSDRLTILINYLPKSLFNFAM